MAPLNCRRKIAEYIQSLKLALFRMKLSCENVVKSDGGDKFTAVIGAGCDHRLIFRFDVVGVDKIEVSALVDAV